MLYYSVSNSTYTREVTSCNFRTIFHDIDMVRMKQLHARPHGTSITEVNNVYMERYSIFMKSLLAELATQ